ncbi:MAG TPA: signal peptidase I, partial [bacterium]|nr:signal peptidase I [bacterium]
MPIWIPLVVLAVLILYRRKIVEEWRFFRTERKEWVREKWKNWGEPFLIAAVLAVLIRTFIVGPYKIPTGSMRPTFMEGDRIFVDKLSYRFQAPKRGDILVFKYPKDKKKDFVKRL